MGPQRFHDLQVFIGLIPTLAVGRVEHLKFLLQPARAAAEYHPPVRQDIHAGNHLGRHDRIPVRHNQHPGAQPDGCGTGRDIAQDGQGIKKVIVTVNRKPALGVIRILGLELGRKHHMVANPDRVITQRIRPLGHGLNPLDHLFAGKRADVGKHNTEFHAPSFCQPPKSGAGLLSVLSRFGRKAKNRTLPRVHVPA